MYVILSQDEKVQRLSREGVGRKRLALEAVGTLPDQAGGEDIVSSVGKPAAVHQRTGQGVASLVEGKVE